MSDIVRLSIAGAGAVSTAGLKAQVSVLDEFGRGDFSGHDVHHAPDCADRLIASIFAGIDRLAG